MSSVKFISYQFLVSGLRSSSAIIILYFFTYSYSYEALSIIVALWSLGNMSSVFLFMSSMTIAPQVFFSNSKFNSSDLEKASYFQIFRFLMCIIFTVLLIAILFVFYDNYLFIIPFIIYNNLYSILPTWKYYSNRQIDKVLYIDFLFRFPIVLGLVLNIFFDFNINIFYGFIILSILQLLYIMNDIRKYFIFKKYNSAYLTFTLSYFYSVYKINIATMLFNTGQVYFISLLAPIHIINQIALIDKIKNLYLQTIGVFISNRISKNRNLIKNDQNFNYQLYLKNNIMVILFMFFLFILFTLFYFLNVYNLIMNIQLTNFIIFIIPMLYVLLTGLSIIMISHLLNSYGKIQLFSKLYIITAFFALIITIVLINNLSYYAILLAGIFHNLFIIFFGFGILKKLKII